MCQEVKQETGQGVTNTPIPQQSPENFYYPNGRQDIADCVKALRRRADMLEALLKSIPETITPDAHSALQYVSSLVWRNL